MSETMYIPTVSEAIESIKTFTAKKIASDAYYVFTGAWHIGDVVCASDMHVLGIMNVSEISTKETFIKTNSKLKDGNLVRFPDYKKVIPSENEIKSTIEFRDTEVTSLSSMITSWKNAFKYLSKLKAEYDSVWIAKIGDELWAYSAGKDISSPCAKILLARGCFIESKKIHWWNTVLNTKYLISIMETIIAIKAKRITISYTNRTGRVLVQADAFTAVLTPIRDVPPRLSDFFVDDSGYDSNKFDKKGEYIG